MPHFIAEYSANLEGVADFPGLFEKVHQVLGDSGVFPLGGIRSRAIRMDIFRMADAKHDYAFVHMTLKVGAGRDLETRKKVADRSSNVSCTYSCRRVSALSCFSKLYWQYLYGNRYKSCYRKY